MQACQCQWAAFKIAKLMWPFQMRCHPKGTWQVRMWNPGALQLLKGDEEASGYVRSETEPSDVQDQPAMAAGSVHAGHQSDDEDPHDGNQSINSGQRKESATCASVVQFLTEVTDSLEVRNAAILEGIQAKV